jgi:hypothetical protein
MLDIDTILDSVRKIPKMKDVTAEDIFICSPQVPWNIKVRDTHKIAYHPNLYNGFCQDCGTDMENIH